MTKEESNAEWEKYGGADWWKREGKWDRQMYVVDSPRMEAIMRTEGWERAEERIVRLIARAIKEGKS